MYGCVVIFLFKNYLEYNSITKPSFKVGDNNARSGIALNTPLASLTSTETHSGKLRESAASKAAFQRKEFLAFSVNCTVSPALTK